MAIVTIGISVLPNHSHDATFSNDGGSIKDNTTMNTTSTLKGQMLLMSGAST